MTECITHTDVQILARLLSALIHRRPEHRNMDDLYSNRKGNSSRRNNVSVENRIRIEGANVTTGRTENDNSRRNENVRREDSRRIETENRERDNSRRHTAPEVRSNGSSIRFTPVKEVRSESSRRTIESRSDSRPSINEGRSEGVRSESSSSGRRANMNRPSAPSNVRTENSGRNNETPVSPHLRIQEVKAVVLQVIHQEEVPPITKEIAGAHDQKEDNSFLR